MAFGEQFKCFHHFVTIFNVVTEPERIIRASNPTSVSSSRMYFLIKPFLDLSGTEPKAKDPRAADGRVINLVGTKRSTQREIASSSASALQSISAAVHFESATINIPDNAEVEPMTPRTEDMGVNPIFLDTTTIGIADTLPL